MRRFIITPAIVVGCWLAATACHAQTPDRRSLAIDRGEQAATPLMLVETLVLDGDGKTVPGLGKGDFQLAVNRGLVEIDSFDIVCPIGAVAEPVEVGERESHPLPPAPDMQRRIVLVVDYVHLVAGDRGPVLDGLDRMVRESMSRGEEIMIAAIGNGLRIEQRFTSDKEEIREQLERMQYDVTLHAADFQAVSAATYFEALSALMDLLAQHDGAKAAVIYSAAVSRPDTDYAQIEDVIRRAAAARTVLYTARAPWFSRPTARKGAHRLTGTAGGERFLRRLAIETGGRIPPASDDLALPYAWAQRDLACRYTLGYRIASDTARKAQDIRVGVTRADALVSYPTQIRLWTEQERQDSRIRAAFADPGPLEHPLVRSWAFPFRPVGKPGPAWDTFIAVHFPMPVGPDGAELDVGASITRQSGKVGEFRDRFRIPGARGAVTRPVTLLGDATLREGPQSLTVVLSSPGLERPVTSTLRIDIPDVPRKGTFLQGPVLGRVVPKGVLVRAMDRDTSLLDSVLSGEESLEPLLVQEIAPSDRGLMFWEACVAGKARVNSGTVVQRKIVAGDRVVFQFEPVAFNPQGQDRYRCHAGLDSFEASKLGPGGYGVHVAIVNGSGTTLAEGAQRLLVDD